MGYIREGDSMTTMATRRLAVLVAVAVTAAAAGADQSPTGAAADNKLIGTWKRISAKYDGQEAKLPEGYTHLKHVTPTQFMWALYDGEGKVASVLGGGYALKDDEYVETPEYGLGDALDQLKGKPQTFTWKVEGNKWHLNGKLSTGLNLEEVWERVERK
jgi:hypothetical protein